MLDFPRLHRRALAIGIAAPTLASLLGAQSCPDGWSDRFGNLDLTGVEARTSLVWDEDGAGPQLPALFVGGTYDRAGGILVNGIGRFDGRSWTSLDSGLSTNGYNRCTALAVYDDDGSGPNAAALYVAGDFYMAGGDPANWIAQWNGTNWSALGTGLAPSPTTINGAAQSLAVFDEDGAGPNPPALFVGGSFVTAGGVNARGLARWNGTAWSIVGTGLTGGNIHADALAVHDPDGAGPIAPSLYVGGHFVGAGGFGPNLARWTGTAWASAGTSGWSSVSALASIDHDGADPNPPILYAGGHHVAPIDNSIARYDGTTWSGVAGGVDDLVLSLSGIHEHGPGPGAEQLYVGGEFAHAGGLSANRVARFDGVAWSALGSGIQGYRVHAMTRFDEDESGPLPARLYVAGAFSAAGSIAARHLARWDGSIWSTLQGGANSVIHDLIAFDPDGGGPADAALIACGDFTRAGGSLANRIARYDGASWSNLGNGLSGPSCKALCLFDDDGPGPNPTALYVGGDIVVSGTSSGVAKWDGTTWLPLGSGLGGRVHALCVFDGDGSGPNQPELVAAGTFYPWGSPPIRNVAKWNGTSWSALGAGIESDWPVRALCVYDEDGAGPLPPALFAGGDFSTAGGMPIGVVARWNGSTWSSVGSGLPGGNWVSAFLVIDTDGPGPLGEDLVAGGQFFTFGGGPSRFVTKWNGSVWSPLGSGMNNQVTALAAFDDDGPGPNATALFAGGNFTRAGAVDASRVAKWDGTAWSPLGGGVGVWQNLDPVVGALAVFDDDGGGATPPALYAGGYLENAGGFSSERIARWGRPACRVTTFCFGDGTGTPCPCANPSPIGSEEGCLNSLGIGGHVGASGTPSLSNDSLVIRGAQMPNGPALYFQGLAQTAAGAGAVFGDGLECATGGVVRLGTKTNTGGASQYPSAGDLPVSVRGNIGLPGTRTYQVWYRNAAAFCTVSTFNLSNGLLVTWSS